MPSSLGRRVARVVALAALALGGSACDEAADEARGAPTAELEGRERARSAGNDPVAVRLNGREVRVRCEVSCEPLDAELERLVAGCRADPLRAPHLVSVAGASLEALGCCTETEHAYREACGLEGALSRCGSEWAARCARGGS